MDTSSGLIFTYGWPDFKLIQCPRKKPHRGSQVLRSPLIVIWPLFDSHMTIRPFSSTIALLDERTVNPLAMMSAVLLFGESCPHRIVLLSSLGEAMRSNIFRALVVLILCGSVFLTDAQVPMKPLTARELI